MIRLRRFRNADTPALAALWNRWAPGAAVARPLSAHEFDAHVAGHPLFDADGLIVAEVDGKTAGFAHAGFGPEDPGGPPWRLCRDLGAIVMLVVEPGEAGDTLADHLFEAARHYLRARGATVLYAGGAYPVNPFYWGIYGGSEYAGILGEPGGSPFARAALRAGFRPAAEAVLLELDLTAPEAKDPKGVLLNRQARLDLDEDALPSNWWESLAVGECQPAVARLVTKGAPEGSEIARATLWDMDAFGRVDGRSRIGLFGMEVRPAHRRQGFGRFLVGKVARLAREQGILTVCVQTAATNGPALALYQSLGFEVVETAQLYRHPGGDP